MQERKFKNDLSFAKELDQQDELKQFRSRFYTKPDEIYMDGNSLGMASIDAENALLKMMEIWKKEGILIWDTENGRYFHYGCILGDKIAKICLNAEPNEVIVTGSTTSNIHQLIATFWKPTKERYKILVDDLNFPTDRYAIDSQVQLKGMKVEDTVKVVPSKDGKTIDEDAVIQAMTDDVALILLPAVLYRSCQLLDMERLTKEAHQRGIIIGWDLCHSIGSVPHDFKKIDCDFAVWCNYKYLSGGPGASAGLYVNKKHFGTPVGLAGWFGNKNETQFRLDQKFEQAPDITAFQTGTPSHLSMAPIEGTLQIFEEAGMDKIRKKSLHISAYLMYLIDTRLTQYGYNVGSPREDHKRGGHVSLEHPEAYRICNILKSEYKVIPDFREPNVIRLAPIALYNTYEEVYNLVNILEEIGLNKKYESVSNVRSLVV